MMQIATIDHYFDYQMKNAIQSILNDYEKSSGDFECGDDLMSFLWDNRKEFGEQVLNQMTEWQEEDDWLAELD